MMMTPGCFPGGDDVVFFRVPSLACNILALEEVCHHLFQQVGNHFLLQLHE